MDRRQEPAPAAGRPAAARHPLTFAIPAGLVVTFGLATYARLAADAQIPEAEIRSGSTLILTIIGLWILVVLSRPVTRFKGLVIGAMMVALVLMFAVPISRDFLQLVDLTLLTATLALGASLVCIGLIEVVRFVHRRLFRRDAERAARQLTAK